MQRNELIEMLTHRLEKALMKEHNPAQKSYSRPNSNDLSALLLSQISEQLAEISQKLDTINDDQPKPSETPEMTVKIEDKPQKKWWEKLL
jgi:hypothetical protein